jgi:hypothetical protein
MLDFGFALIVSAIIILPLLCLRKIFKKWYKTKRKYEKLTKKE